MYPLLTSLPASSSACQNPARRAVPGPLVRLQTHIPLGRAGPRCQTPREPGLLGCHHTARASKEQDPQGPTSETRSPHPECCGESTLLCRTFVGFFFFFSLFNVQAVKKVCLLSLAVCFGLLFSGTALKGRKRLLCTAGMAGSEPRGGQRARDGCPHCVHGANPWGLRDPGACDARPGLSLPCTASKWPSPPVGQAPSCGCQSPLPCSFQLRLACISLLCVASGLEVTFCVMSYKTVH